MAFASFMSSSLGRILRIILGLVIIYVGLTYVDTPWKWVVELIGLAPLLAGIMDICLFAPLFGGPLKGADARKLGK